MYQPTVGYERFDQGRKAAFQRPLPKHLHHIAGIVQRRSIFLATDDNSDENSYSPLHCILWPNRELMGLISLCEGKVLFRVWEGKATESLYIKVVLENRLPDKRGAAGIIASPLNVDGAVVQQSYDGRCDAREAE